MIRAIGSLVCVLATALIVIAFVELLIPSSKTTGLTRAVMGLCIIALVLDLVLSLFSTGPQFEIESSTRAPLGAEWDEQYLSEGKALAEETLSAIGQAGDSTSPSPSSDVSDSGDGFVVRVSAPIRQVRVQVIPRVEVGELDD